MCKPGSSSVGTADYRAGRAAGTEVVPAAGAAGIEAGPEVAAVDTVAAWAAEEPGGTAAAGVADTAVAAA